ncbi:MAG: GTP-binding protein, partial [bacterium]
MLKNIRNFAIIAHVDHGKSTLADRLLELTGTIKGKHDEQMLDRNPISRERGITIKLAPVRMMYKNSKPENLISKQSQNSNLQTPNILEFRDSRLEIASSEFILNLIDTPGHVDFTYEVDRTLSCVEGVILLVDATQGIQAQTVSNAYKAIDKNLVIIPVVNKIDLPSADVEMTKKSIVNFLGIDENEIFEISAKTGAGVKAILEAIVTKIPPPVQSTDILTKALIFDSYYDSHKGVIAFVRIFSGSIKKAQKLKVGSASNEFTVNEVGTFHPELTIKGSLDDGEIGYVVTNLKDIHKIRVGDSLLDLKLDKPLPGYKRISPMVFASVFTVDPNNYLNLKKALEKLYLNDSALEFSSIYSKALGAGFRVGFLGLLHADVVRERLEREYDL